MAILALALYVFYLAIAFGLRTLIQLRRTGSTGFHGLGGRPGSAEWIAGVGFTLALLLGVAAPVLALLGLVEPFAALDASTAHVAGLLLAVAGIAATFHAQVAMGESWRIGVEEGERTRLVTGGPFALELQVRVVEEPYLLRAHGAGYAEYAARVGRFLPGVGRIGQPHP